MNVYDSAHALAEIIRQSEEAQDYARLKEIAEGDETNRALLSEYRRLQMKLQLASRQRLAVAGGRSTALSADCILAVYEQRCAGIHDGGTAPAKDAGGYF